MFERMKLVSRLGVLVIVAVLGLMALILFVVKVNLSVYH